MLLGDKKRFYAKRIAREAKSPGLRIPDCGGIHSLCAEPCIIAPPHKAREEGLDVAVGLERVRTADLPAKIEMVHDLPVTDDREPSVRTEDRLVAAGKIDNAEAPHSEAEVRIDMDALIIGATMDERTALRFDDRSVDRAAASPVPASDPAHVPENALRATARLAEGEALLIGN